MKRLFVSGVAALSLLGFASTADAATAILRGLDKLTGHAKDFSAPVGTPVRFGSIQVVVRACQKTPPEETPEVTVYLEIRDLKARGADGKPLADKPLLFSGWMFASSPARNALEHPVYDVWAIDCRT